MTPAFDAAVAECRRLRLKWKFGVMEGTLREDGERGYLPTMEITSSSVRRRLGSTLILPWCSTEEAVRDVRFHLSLRCLSYQFRKKEFDNDE